MSTTDTNATETEAVTFEAFTVTLDTEQGQAQLDLKASSEEMAGKRAWLAAVQAGWGDVDTVTVVSVEPCTDWDDQPGF